MSQHALLLSISVSSVIAFVLDDHHQYCTVRYKRLCQGKGPHVACESPEEGPGESCENYTSIKFTDDLKHFITHYINRRRQRIAMGAERVRGGLHLPKPEVMMLVEWDRELAYLAQRLADQCRFVHDDCRATVRYPYAGQTVGEVRWRRSSDSDELSAQRAIRRVFDAWWGERRRVTPKLLTTPFRLNNRGGGYGHFTQLAVWTLRAVGCAAVRHGADYPRLLLVCDFSHTNMLGQRTLVPGSLKPCPLHTVRRPRSPYPLLCGPVHREKAKTSEKLTAVNHDYDNVNDDSDHQNDDDDGEVNEDITEDVGDVSTSSMLVQASREKIQMPVDDDKKYFKFKNDDFKLIENNIKKVPRKELIMEKLERELQKKKTEHESKGSDEVVLHQFLTKRPFIDRWRENQKDKKAKMTNLRKTVSPVTHGVSFYGSVSRPRWKQQRERPLRPGANALLNLVTDKIVVVRKTSIAPFTLDKEDIEQLFKDTGFSLSSRNDQH